MTAVGAPMGGTSTMTAVGAPMGGGQGCAKVKMRKRKAKAKVKNFTFAMRKRKRKSKNTRNFAKAKGESESQRFLLFFIDRYSLHLTFYKGKGIKILSGLEGLRTFRSQ